MDARLTAIELGSTPIERFRPLLDEQSWRELDAGMRELATALRGRTLWNINSTAQGGGVAEMLAALIPYERGAGIDERWLVIDGSPPFFAMTKRMHNLLHGMPADGSEISAGEVNAYESTMAANAAALKAVVRSGDVVLLQDPQVAGLAPALVDLGARVVWRCHVGVDAANDLARVAWRMLRPYLASASAVVFSRSAYVWEGIDRNKVRIITPTIDPFSVKNQELGPDAVTAILAAAGLMTGDAGAASFERADGTMARVTREAAVCGGSLPPDARVVVQVSRWDRLKDPIGVMRGFAEHVAPRADSRLVLAGPAVKSVQDDPEQPAVLNDVIDSRDALEPSIRDRVHVAQLPMDDVEENAAIVNALQRRADVVVQKSLAEGFGLTVAEAMWKARPIVASRVGGIEDQIEDGTSGLLVDDPADLDEFGADVVRMLGGSADAQQMGREARRRAMRRFIVPHHMVEQARLVLDVLAADC